LSRVLFIFSFFLYTLRVLTAAYLSIALFAGITVISHIVICIGIFRMRRRGKHLSGGKMDISVIIPARNEEANLPRLFVSLEPQIENIREIVFINDRSDDGTGGLLRDFQEKHGSRVKIVTLASQPPDSGCNPKQYALLRGIEAADGDILLFTDADCAVPPEWTDRMCRPFLDPGVGLCIGPIQTEGDGRFLYRYQYFDHIFRYFYTAGSAGTGMPTGGFGNNLAVRKDAVTAAGGYGSIGYSVTEDAALIVAVRDRTDFTITAATSKESAVTALPQHAWRVLSKQERRWSYGAFRSPDPQTVFGYAAVMIFLFAGLAAIPLSFLFSPFSIIIASTFSSMLMVAAAGGICLGCGFKEYWLFLLPNIFFSSLFYTYNNFLSFVNIPITWKGKALDKM
jgi:cellulose synthase/poly-beta-1,6-N-acetylglucosamine synthase-like glycosyltransferase